MAFRSQHEGVVVWMQQDAMAPAVVEGEAVVSTSYAHYRGSYSWEQVGYCCNAVAAAERTQEHRGC